MYEMEDRTKKRRTILYAVLTSESHGRPQTILKSIQPGNGFECYRVLAVQATLQLRARALALLQSILQYTFGRSATLTENFQRLDDLVKGCEGASGGKEVGDDILVGMLFKNAPAQVRSWLLGHLKEDTPYSQVREAVRSWDMQTYRWADTGNRQCRAHRLQNARISCGEVNVRSRAYPLNTSDLWRFWRTFLEFCCGAYVFRFQRLLRGFALLLFGSSGAIGNSCRVELVGCLPFPSPMGLSSGWKALRVQQG